jgi:two-component system, NtrC family, response regulator AtoC
MSSSEGGYQLVAFSGDEIRTFDLPRAGEATIGRDEVSTVRIEDPSVSRRHAVLRVGDALEIEDLGGANGTFVRRTALGGQGNETLHVDVQQLVRRKAEVAVGDCLLLGKVCLVVRHRARMMIPDLVSGDLSGVAAASGVVVRDPAMRALYGQAARAARTSINILLLGETGVGKEVLARAIHAHSSRAKGPFVGINCAAIADSLLESELFGSERGAFTGALTRSGLFEAANGGTVFLDEIGEMPLGTQAKLLRVLEDRSVTRLGSTRSRAIDVRFLAATNRDVEADSKSGRLRPDLYFRLNGVALFIPPLRERPLEIEVLATSFLEAACRDLERGAPLALSPDALGVLLQHVWPGNVRELRNAVERAAVMCSENAVLPEHLPPSLLAAVRTARSHPPLQTSSSLRVGLSASANLQAEMREIERRKIFDALERCDGNQSEAARQLGMPRRTLVSRLREIGLTRRHGPNDEPS